MRTVALTSVMALAVVMASWLSGFTQQPQQPTQQPPQPLAGATAAAPPMAAAVTVAVPQNGAPGGDVQVLSTLFANGVQQLVYVDTRQQAIAVYQVQAGTGKLELKSVRRIAHDLAIEQFNAVEPLPSDMRLIRQ